MPDAFEEQMDKLLQIGDLAGLHEPVAWIRKLRENSAPKPVGLCGVNGCVRPAGHPEKRHRYTLNDNQAKERAATISRQALDQARANQRSLDSVQIGRHSMRRGDPCKFESSTLAPNAGRGWLGVITDLYAKDDKEYAVIFGAKGSSNAKREEKIIQIDRLIYVRPNSQAGHDAKVRAGKYA